MRPEYEVLDHPADLLMKAYGKTLEEAFINIAMGMYDQMLNYNNVMFNDDAGSFTIIAQDMEGLLQRYLDELLFIFETEGMIFNITEVDINTKDKKTPNLKAKYAGTARYKPEIHGIGIEIKAVTYHMIEIGKSADGYYVQVLFDI